MKKVMAFIFEIILEIFLGNVGTIVITGCNQASKVNNYIMQEARNLNITRKLVVFNQKTGETVFIAIGNFALDKKDGYLGIIGEDEDGYYEHLVYLSSEIGYTCEQLRRKIPKSPATRLDFLLSVFEVLEPAVLVF